MRKPLSIAMLFSVVIHGVCFAVLTWLISNRAEPSISTAILSVTLHPSTAWDNRSAKRAPEGDAADSELAVATIDHLTAKILEQQAKTEAVPETRIGFDNPARSPVAAGEASAPGQHAVANQEQSDIKSEIALDSNVLATSQAEVVMTTSNSETDLAMADRQARLPAVRQVALSPKQEKMLTEKFEEWADDADRLPDADAGLTWDYKGQEYFARFKHLEAEDDMGIQRLLVEVSTEEDGERLSTEMRMKRLAFSSYAQFVNRWDPDVQLQNDEFEGRFHSNTRINLAYDRKVKPRFHGEVTTSASTINITDRRGRVNRDEIFLGGLQTGVKAIRWPKQVFPLADTAPVKEHQVHRFDTDTHITFHADGTYSWQPIEAESAPERASISEDTSYLIAAKNVSLHVKGTVNGKVLVYSPKRIVIEDDLVYARHPDETPGADDYLGLVSDKFIDVAPAEITGPGDLVITAAIYAKRRFAVKGYRSRDNALLSIYGSLIAGSLSATEPRYRTRIRFDRRLEKQRPPGFPMTNRYAVEFWDNSWKVAPAAASH